MKRLTWYNVLGATALAVAGIAGILAGAGAFLAQGLSVAAASLCAIVFLVPGLYFLAFARRLRSREIVLAHAAAFAATRPILVVADLAAELDISNAVAEKVLRTAIREGHLQGRFDSQGRFIASKESEPGGTS
ncbi:MAG TPA: hypothetical protein VJP06_01460 [Thermoplasmata archaeon]|nr:hypothetical protein [Thermoplasmata archaeon]